MKFRFDAVSAFLSLVISGALLYLSLDREFKAPVFIKLYCTLPFIFASVVSGSAHDPPVLLFFIGLCIQSYVIVRSLKVFGMWLKRTYTEGI